MTAQVLAAGRYTIERVLGQGGMASVLLAHDRQLDRRVAIKLLAEHLADDDEFRARFLREGRLSSRLTHANIVQVFDAGEADGRPFIVMEYVEGETLAELIRREGRVAPAAVVELGIQACAGLEHAHQAGLIHRDVKPANLLIRRADGCLKVADFGIARAAEMTRHTQLGAVLGTAAYLSPEQAAGEDVTASADIYSLGAVLYELLTGETPHRFESLVELAFKHREAVITPVRSIEPAVPAALESVVMRTLAREARFRPASAALLAHELVSASDPPTQPLPRPAGARASDARTAQLPLHRFASGARRRALVWTAAAVLVVLLAAAIGALASGGRPHVNRPATGTAAPGPVPYGATPEQEALNFSAWLRKYAR